MLTIPPAVRIYLAVGATDLRRGFEGQTYRGWTLHVVLTATAFTFLPVERWRDAPAPRETLLTISCASNA